jgi:hypothetical protein
MDQITVSLLERVGHIMSSTKENSEFFARIPGYTYQWARFTDWINPYLTDIIFGKTYQYKSSSNKLIK